MTTAQLIELLQALDPAGDTEVLLTDPVMKWYRMPVVTVQLITVNPETFFPQWTGKRYNPLVMEGDSGQKAIYLKTT